jgi:uncharacterized protein YbbC (DUF1343 family)
MLQKLSFFILFFSLIVSAQIPVVKTGVEVLRDNNFNILSGKKVGLITNQTGVDSKLKSTVDILFEAKNFELIALFGPEHGVRGDFHAGDKVESNIDPKTNLPVYSLYGATRKPTIDMLKGLDVLIYDIQDIGCRSYTYISTMGLAMEAASENNIDFVVLDRPNPLSGLKVEGNLVEDGFISFVSQFKIPYVYGLTCGELAEMLNEEGMLSGKVNLTVVPMQNWNREMRFEDTGLQWVPTSPHIPHYYSSIYYVTTGIMGELGSVSEGVGYTLPFQLMGAEWIDGSKVANRLNELGLEGVIFRPATFKPYYGRDAKKELHGVQVHITDFSKVNLMSLQFHFMDINNQLYPDKNPFDLADKSRYSMFDKVTGTSKVRELFNKNMKYNDIKSFLEKDVEEFKKLSQKYFMY